jgi:hypothetical protein
MAEIEFDVYYAPERSDGVFFEEMQTVSRLTNFLVSRFRLPDTSQGMRVEYGLFLDQQGPPLDPGKTCVKPGFGLEAQYILLIKRLPGGMSPSFAIRANRCREQDNFLHRQSPSDLQSQFLRPSVGCIWRQNPLRYRLLVIK